MLSIQLEFLADQAALPAAPANMSPDMRAALQVFLVNADIGIIEAMRPLITLSHEFIVQLHQAILAQIARPFNKYDRQMRALQDRYQSKKMLNIAIARCEGGD